MKKILIPHFILIISLAFTASVDIQDEIRRVINSKNMLEEQKTARLERIAQTAYQTRYAKALLMISDFFLDLRERKKAIKYYRQSGRIALIKNNYMILYACGLRLAYLVDKDEGALYLYQAGVRAMRNSDWYFTVRIARAFIKLERYKSASKWLERAGAGAAIRKSVNGLYLVSKVYESLGNKYRHKALYWYTAARQLEKKKSGIQN